MVETKVDLTNHILGQSLSYYMLGEDSVCLSLEAKVDKRYFERYKQMRERTFTSSLLLIAVARCLATTTLKW